MSDSLGHHESQHARPPCPSPSPRIHSNIKFHANKTSSENISWPALDVWFPNMNPTPLNEKDLSSLLGIWLYNLLSNSTSISTPGLGTGSASVGEKVLNKLVGRQVHLSIKAQCTELQGPCAFSLSHHQLSHSSSQGEEVWWKKFYVFLSI